MKLYENNYLMSQSFALCFIRIGQKLWIFITGQLLDMSRFFARTLDIRLNSLEKTLQIDKRTWYVFHWEVFCNCFCNRICNSKIKHSRFSILSLQALTKVGYKLDQYEICSDLL